MLPCLSAHLLWFLTRGVGRWIGKAWRWVSYADLRADARAARLAGDVQARRTAQELIRADARARWAKLGVVARRTLVTAAVVGVLVLLLAAIEQLTDRTGLPGWLQAVYAVRDAVAAGLVLTWSWLPALGTAAVVVPFTPDDDAALCYIRQSHFSDESTSSEVQTRDTHR